MDVAVEVKFEAESLVFSESHTRYPKEWDKGFSGRNFKVGLFNRNRMIACRLWIRLVVHVCNVRSIRCMDTRFKLPQDDIENFGGMSATTDGLLRRSCIYGSVEVRHVKGMLQRRTLVKLEADTNGSHP